jgi:hypothetical protein
LGALKIGCSLLSFLGPKGVIAGSIIQTGIDIGMNFADAKKNMPISSKSKNFDSNLDKAIGDYKNLLNEQNNK